MNDSNDDCFTFQTILSSSKLLNDVLGAINTCKEEKYFVGAGAVAQTIWNAKFGYPDGYGIDDIDIIYFNDINISKEDEEQKLFAIREILKDICQKIDLKNQARVHLWYKEKFGTDIDPIYSIENAISRWPTTSTSIAVRINNDSKIEIIAPFGIDDLIKCKIRPNKIQITKEIYEAKIFKWIKKWPELEIENW